MCIYLRNHCSKQNLHHISFQMCGGVCVKTRSYPSLSECLQTKHVAPSCNEETLRGPIQSVIYMSSNFSYRNRGACQLYNWSTILHVQDNSTCPVKFISTCYFSMQGRAQDLIFVFCTYAVLSILLVLTLVIFWHLVNRVCCILDSQVLHVSRVRVRCCLNERWR